MEQTKEATYTLSFGVVPEKDGLFCAAIYRLRSDKGFSFRKGTPTTLGHAVGIAETLMSNYSVYAHETVPANFFNEAVIP